MFPLILDLQAGCDISGEGSNARLRISPQRRGSLSAPCLLYEGCADLRLSKVSLIWEYISSPGHVGMLEEGLKNKMGLELPKYNLSTSCSPQQSSADVHPILSLLRMVPVKSRLMLEGSFKSTNQSCFHLNLQPVCVPGFVRNSCIRADVNSPSVDNAPLPLTLFLSLLPCVCILLHFWRKTLERFCILSAKQSQVFGGIIIIIIIIIILFSLLSSLQIILHLLAA